MPPGPLVALFTDRHDPGGVVPAAPLVQAAAEAGHRNLALVDFQNLESAPGFLEACREHGVHPILGMTLAVSLDRNGPDRRRPDVFDLHPLEGRETPRPREEWTTLLALNREGFQNLLRLQEISGGPRGQGVAWEELAAAGEGLHLLLGPPGSILDRVISGRRTWRSSLAVEPLLSLFPRSRTSFAGLDSGADERGLAERIARLEKLPRKIPPLAVHWAAYRRTQDRFWGLARAILSRAVPPHTPRNPLLLEPPNFLRISLQGLPGALSRIEKIARPESDLLRHYRSTPPVYPAPRGTDTDTLFWTLGQEAAIASGHMRLPEAKERLYEEFQFYKQTDWPTVFLLLWDLRRRLGLPPGTLRPAQEWIATSLFAHTLGLSRVDPIRSELPFHPRALELNPNRSVEVDLEVPHGLEGRLLAAAEEILGAAKAVVIRPKRVLEDHEELLGAGRELLSQWEELGLSGNRPIGLPPPPPGLEESHDDEPPATLLHLSGRSVFFSPSAPARPESPLAFDRSDSPLLGGLHLALRPKPLLTLAAAPIWRDDSRLGEDSVGETETVSDWIEKREGRVFRSPTYADDSGPFPVLGLSASLVRLLTLPESYGYRPILWQWLRESPPMNLGELADCLALAHHWSFWSNRPELRLRACQSPFRSRGQAGDSPPWWEGWERFIRDSGIEARVAARMGVCLERQTLPTGGWLLYADQLQFVLREALGWSAESAAAFLRAADSYSELEGEDFGPLSEEAIRRFEDFLGHPNPLPERVVFLKKAAEMLAAAETFLEDPCAWAASASFLFDSEVDERRTLYRLLPTMGCGVSAPRFPAATPHAVSEAPGDLTLGLTDIHGIGPRYASKIALEAVAGVVESPAALFAQSIQDVPVDLLDWLKERDQALTPRVMERLIHLGFFDRREPDRKKLLHGFRNRLARRNRLVESNQVLLFDLDIAAPSSPDPAGPISGEGRLDDDAPPIHWELNGLRLPISGSPLQEFRGRIPDRWIEPGPPENRIPGLRVGWVYDVEAFGRPLAENSASTDANRSVFRFSFLLHETAEAVRIEDPEGMLEPLLPEDGLRESRLDGRRLHLKDPLRLVLGLFPISPARDSLPSVYTLEAVERVDDLLEAAAAETESGPRSNDWSSIRAVVSELDPDRVEELGRLAAWFAAPPFGISTRLEAVDRQSTVRSISLFRRKAPRPPVWNVLPSGVLLDRLRRTPGVEEAIPIPRQTPLFEESEARGA